MLEESVSYIANYFLYFDWALISPATFSLILNFDISHASPLDLASPFCYFFQAVLSIHGILSLSLSLSGSPSHSAFSNGFKQTLLLSAVGQNLLILYPMRIVRGQLT